MTFLVFYLSHLSGKKWKLISLDNNFYIISDFLEVLLYYTNCQYILSQGINLIWFV